jgi:hypothetical protein
MIESVKAQFSEEERVKVLLHEYATLRNEILTRTTHLYQLIAVGTVLFVWIMGQPLTARSWVVLGVGVFLIAFFYRLISRDIEKAARRLRELEEDINHRAGETLLVWERKWGGAVVGHWGRGKPYGDFREPILRILLKLGGHADRVHVLCELEVQLATRLTEFDKKDIKSGSIRWQKSAEREVNGMRQQGLLLSQRGSGRGVWSLSAAGATLAQRISSHDARDA